MEWFEQEQKQFTVYQVAIDCTLPFSLSKQSMNSSWDSLWFSYRDAFVSVDCFLQCGFFDRARPPQDDMADREQLTNNKTTDA